MIDIRDHGGVFGGSSMLPSNFGAINMEFDAKVTQVDMNGDIYGKTRGRFTTYPTYYHNDKNKTLIKSKSTNDNSIIGWEKTGYYKASGMTVTKYSHADQVIETFTVPGAVATILAAIKVNTLWIIFKSSTLFVYNTAGTLISSYNATITTIDLQINPFGNVIAESVEVTMSGGSQAFNTDIVLVEKAGTIVSSIGYRSHTFDSATSTEAIKATIAQWKLLFLYNK